MEEKNNYWLRYTAVVILIVAVIVIVAMLWPHKVVSPPAVTVAPVVAPVATAPSDAPAPVTIPAEAPASEIASPLTITNDYERGIDTIKHGSKVVGDIPNGWGVYKTKVIRVTDKAVYLESCRKEVNGYMLFGVCPRRIYRVTLANNELRNVVDGPRGNIDMAEDVSPKESLVALGRSDDSNQGSPSVVVKFIEGSEPEQVFPVSHGYNQLGDLRFSPDGKKVAYAVAVGSPHNEAGAVFVVDLKANTQTKVAEIKTPNSYFRIKGWKDATTVDFTEVGL